MDAAQQPYGTQPPYGYGAPPMYGYGMPPMYGYNTQPMYNGYGMPGTQNAPQRSAPQDAAVQTPEFPSFIGQGGAGSAAYNNNLQMLMNVQLDVAVVVGRAKRKIKDIMDFGQGTVVELDKQTGAPAEIMVNGQLLAYGDVVVVGDNFGVRVTEIVGTKDLLYSLNGDSNK